MSKEQSKSDVARRREQLRRKQEKRQQQNRMIQIGAGIAAVAIVVVLVFAFVLDGGSDPEDEAAQGDFAPVAGERPLAEIEPVQRANAFDAYPEFVIDTANSYEAVIQTDVGEMRLELFDDEAPQTVNSFVFLANQGFYDGIAFHRVIDGFMAQGGDPTGTGAAGPGYSFADEFESGLTFDRPGLLAMANSGPNTNGSQFFITFVPTPHLDGAHTIFGKVIEGQEVLDQITRRTPDDPNAPPGTVIERIEIYEAQGG